MAITQPSDIKTLAQQHHDSTSQLRTRMEADQSLYMLEQFSGKLKGMTADQLKAEEGYLHYTSSEPRNLFNKVQSLIMGSKVILSISDPSAIKQMREIDNLKEQFVRGVLRSADDRLERMIQPTLLDTLAYDIPLRGWAAGRALLKNRPDGRTVVDVTPWDPLHTHWSVTEDGLQWIVYKMGKTRAQIFAEYGIRVGNLETDPTGIETVYDYYDGQTNAVSTENLWLKPETPHGLPGIPCYIVNVGNAPIRPMETNNSEWYMDWGESIYSASRDNYKTASYMSSILLHLLAQQRDPTLILKSPGGAKTLDENVRKAGSDVSLDSNDSLDPMKFVETTKDLALLLQIVQGEIQRGTLPTSAYGEISFAISGFAINSLNQSIGSLISPRLKAVSRAFDQISHLLIAHYSTGAYDGFSLSGMGSNKRYFDATMVTPQVVMIGGDPKFTLEAQLPQDDAGRLQAAQILRTAGPNGLPLVDDGYIRTETLKLSNEDRIADAVLNQAAESGIPLAKLRGLYDAAVSMQNHDLAQYYWVEMWKQKVIQVMEIMQMGLQPPPQPGAEGGAANPAKPSGPRPQDSPQALTTPETTASAADKSNPGAQVPPGTPRPGAQRGPMEQIAGGG